jgi:hypothetical protein
MNNRLSFRRFLTSASLWFLTGILLFAPWARADGPPQRSMENRFLFVIDTSSAMKARKQGVLEAVNELLQSGMKGELRKADTIGLWTYSDHLDTDFPMEVWSDQKKDTILQEMREHVDHLRYEKRAHLEKAMPSIMQVLANSERLTVIFIFDGSDSIKGTPFDKDINELQKRYAREFRASSEPFVTVLAARNGLFFDYTINYPSTVIVPHTADPLPPPETNAPPIVTVTAPSPPEPVPAPPKTNVQIILSGSDFAHKSSPPPPTATNITTSMIPEPGPVPAAATNVPPPVETVPIAAQSSAQTNAVPTEPQPTSEPIVLTPTPMVSTTAPTKPVITKPANPVVAEPASSSMAAGTNTLAPPSDSKAFAPIAPAAVPIVPAVVAATTAELVMAFSLLTIAIVLVLFLVRRWRGGSQPSLISQSIDRPR